MDSRQAHLVYDFGEFQLDARRRVLSLRGDGRALPVTGKVIDTLLYFVERAGQLLDKRTLMEALWPNVVVEENNLTQTVYALRRVLGERPDEHRFIVTVPGRGYRFVADVVVHSLSGSVPMAPEPTPRHIQWAALVVASFAVVGALLLSTYGWPGGTRHTQTAVAAAPSIAVLPFVDMSEERSQEYFGDGLSEEILNLLAQSDALRVVARTSSFSFKGQSADIATIADKLDVTHVLEGSVRKAGDRVRITAQLVDGVTGVHLWSQTYDRDLTDIFSVQADIAAAVADALQVTLAGTDERRAGETSNTQALESHLQGRYFFNRRGATDVARAREYFERALRIDPGYARAWAGLAGAYYVSLADLQSIPEDALRAWHEAVTRALALGPSLAEAHVRAAQYFGTLGETRIADEHCKRAIALSPSDPLVLSVSAGKAIQAGNWSEGISLQRRAVAVDPLSAAGRGNLGTYLAAVGEWDEARAELEKARELSPTLSRIDADIARVLVLQQRFDEALAAARQLPEGPLRDQCLALAHRPTGRGSQADAALARLIESSRNPATDPLVEIYIAEVYAFRGDGEEAAKWIGLALTDTASPAPDSWTREELLRSPFLRTLMRNDPRLQPLVARAQEQ